MAGPCTALNCSGAGFCCASDGGCVATGTFNFTDYRCRDTATAACNVCGAQRASTCSSAGACLCGTAPNCSAGQSCNGATSSCNCSAASCPTGCCLGGSSGQCIPTTVNNCRKSSTACQPCGPEADGCGSGATGCTCGTGPACAAGEICQNGVCTCNGSSGCFGCCNGSNRCSTATNSACGRSGTCMACASTNVCSIAGSGLCQGCSLSCSTCCMGDQCASGSPSAYPFCAATATAPACETCDLNRSTQCHPTDRFCACGNERQCGLGEKCVVDGGTGTSDHCECDRDTCAGCCEALGGGRSRCAGTLSITACASPSVPAKFCLSCADAGLSADECLAGVCKCGPNAACAGGLRCFKDQCVP